MGCASAPFRVPKQLEAMSRFARAVWFSVLAPLVVALISFVAITVWTHYERSATVTQVRFFIPTQPHGIAIARDAGSCFADFSIADSGAPEAHRCFSNRNIYDPCFPPPGGGEVSSPLLCSISPWTHQLVLFRVRKWMVDQPKTLKILTFPANSEAIYRYVRRGFLNTRENLPWALDLGNGLHCIFATGATGLIRGLRQNYLCTHEDFLKAGWWKHAGWVIGTPDRRHALWRVIYLAPGGQASHDVVVATAWY